jgi:hypothetical protein
VLFAAPNHFFLCVLIFSSHAPLIRRARGRVHALDRDLGRGQKGVQRLQLGGALAQRRKRRLQRLRQLRARRLERRRRVVAAGQAVLDARVKASRGASARTDHKRRQLAEGGQDRGVHACGRLYSVIVCWAKFGKMPPRPRRVGVSNVGARRKSVHYPIRRISSRLRHCYAKLRI